jgi:hypothetical protein
LAIVAMADAVPGAIASSSEYNKLIDNIEDLDSRLTFQRMRTITVTSNSSTWNSATEVITNLVASGGNAVSLVSGKIYRITCNFTVSSGTVASTVGYRIRAVAGTTAPTSADTLVVATPDRLHTAGGAVSRQTVIGEFTAPSSGNFSFALFGCNPSGDTAVAGLYGSSSTSGNGLCTNYMIIDKVG